MPFARLRFGFLAVGIALVLAAGCKKPAKKEAPPDSNPRPAVPNAGGGGDGKAASGTIPAGWDEARDTVAGFRVLIPGKAVIHADFSNANPQAQKLQLNSTSHYVKDPEKEVRVKTLSYLPPAGFKLGSAPDELYAAFGVMHPNFASLNEILEKAPMTLGGQPALKLVTRPIDLTAGAKLSDDPVFAKDQLERRQKLAAKRSIYYVTTHGQRIIYVLIEAPTDPDPNLVKTVIESFKFQ
jgi:hypothetical protein